MPSPLYGPDVLKTHSKCNGRHDFDGCRNDVLRYPHTWHEIARLIGRNI